MNNEMNSEDNKIENKAKENIIVLKLTSEENSSSVKTLKFDKDRIIFGSVISADVKISGEGISPIHAVLEISNENSNEKPIGTIYDLASLSGVFVNSQKVVMSKVSSGDKITVGSYTIEFFIEDLKQAIQKEVIRKTPGRTLFLDSKEDFTPLLLENEIEVEEIFDYWPSSVHALEVVMSWNGTILSVEHFVHQKKITVGNSKKSDFGIPPLLSSNHYPIVTQSGGTFVLNLDSQMKGVMQKSGNLKTLDEVRSSSIRGPNGYEIPIGKNDFAKITIGEIDFYFNYGIAPPRLKRRKIFERDPFFLKILASSAVLTGLILFLLFKVKLNINIEPEQVPERLATILYEPEKYIRPPEVKKVNIPLTQSDKTVSPDVQKPIEKFAERTATKKEKQILTAKSSVPKNAGSKEGEGIRAKGSEGAQSARNSQISQQTHDEDGSVDILRGAGGRLQGILGNSAQRLQDDGKPFKGFGNFNSGGGMALSGDGVGGKGDAESALGGTGNKANGSGQIGTGRAAVGTGTGIVGSKSRVSIRPAGPEESVVMGSIDRDAIAEAIYAHRDEFRLCYEKEINAENPKLSGQVVTSFVIGSSGRVTQAGIDNSSLNNVNAERCIIKVLKRIEFPTPRGGVVEVRFPFKFSST